MYRGYNPLFAELTFLTSTQTLSCGAHMFSPPLPSPFIFPVPFPASSFSENHILLLNPNQQTQVHTFSLNQNDNSFLPLACNSDLEVKHFLADLDVMAEEEVQEQTGVHRGEKEWGGGVL